MSKVLRVLGTGGTIAGVAAAGAADNRYTAGQLTVRDLLAPLMPRLQGLVNDVEPVEVARLDSSHMSHEVWWALAQAVAQVQRDEGVAGAVITHGTDTLEETAVFLDGLLLIEKPVVMTAAMRPATSIHADGPAHLQQALALAADPHARGLLFAFAGKAWRAADVRKISPFAMEAFGAGDARPVALWEPGDERTAAVGRWQWVRHDRAHLVDPDRPRAQLPDDPARWPVVDIICSHAGASGSMVPALLGSGTQGLVISATGNGSIHQAIDRELHAAVRAGQLRRDQVLVASRCTAGSVVGEPAHGWPVSAHRTPAQARVELMLRLAATRSSGAACIRPPSGLHQDSDSSA